MSRVSDEEARQCRDNPYNPSGGILVEMAADLLDARARIKVLEGVLRGILGILFEFEEIDGLGILFEVERSLAEKDAKIAEQARELSLCREWRDAVQGIAVDAGVVITGDPIEDVRLAIEFRDTAIAEQAEEIERLRKEEGGEE